MKEIRLNNRLSNLLGHLKPKLVTCLQENYNLDTLKKDFIAGISVAIVSLPLNMALAISSGTSPDKGIFTAIVAGFIVALFGGTRLQIAGPTAAFIAVVCSISNKYGFNGLLIATLMAGIILSLAGIFKIGSLIKYIPHSIITGFTTGLAVVIFSTQIKDFLGLTLESVPSDFLRKWVSYYQNLNSIDFHTTFIGVISIILIITIRKYWPKLPSFLIAVILATSLVTLLHWNVATIGSKFGAIPRSLPIPSLPMFSYQQILNLLPAAFTIAFLAGIESLLSAVIADNITGSRHYSNAELLAQGLANITSVCFGGLPVTGAIARTVTNVRSGGKTPVAGMVNALLIMIFIWMFASIASLVPLSCLAAILLIVAWDMSELKKFCYFLSAPHGDKLVLIVTFMLTILVDLTVAIEVGLTLACLIFMQRMSKVTEIICYDQFHPDQVPDSCLYKINGPLFFGVTSKIGLVFNDKLVGATVKICIIDLQNVPLIDASGVHVLTDFIEKQHLSGIKVILCGLNERLHRVLRKMDFKKLISQEIIASNLGQAVSLSRNLV